MPFPLRIQNKEVFLYYHVLSDDDEEERKKGGWGSADPKRETSLYSDGIAYRWHVCIRVDF